MNVERCTHVDCSLLFLLVLPFLLPMFDTVNIVDTAHCCSPLFVEANHFMATH